MPTIRAAALLARGDPARAIEALALAAPYELGGNQTLNFVLYPVYVRGQAYLAARQGAAAALEFQKILSHRAVVRNEPIGALANLQLGRAFGLSGDKPKARNAYADFLKLWKDADSDLPILKEARTQFGKIQQ